MKLFKFQGGVHPEGHKAPSADKPIRPLPLPQKLYISLQQHAGLPALPVVNIGQQVRKGELLARNYGAVSAPIHAPSSGHVVAIGQFMASHPSGLPTLTISLETDGEDRWCENLAPADPFVLSPQEVAERVSAAGIVGMGGASFPAGVKLDKARKAGVHTLVVNGAECEPYVTCDDRLMRERSEQIIDGVRITLHALQAEQALIAVEDNKPEAIASLSSACRDQHNIEVLVMPTHYPAGSAKQLTQIVTGQEVPAGGRGTDTGILVHNVGTIYAIQQALRFGRPLVSRIVTVSGGAISNPQNLEVPIGALASELLNYCGVSQNDACRLIMGGPMMGYTLPSVDVPIIKGSSGILALAADETGQEELLSAPCIRCGRCVNACPMGLLPLEIANRTRHNDLKGIENFGLSDCIACGSCTYACPSHIPLLQYLQFARGKIDDRRRAEQKTKATHQLMEQHRERLEREEKAKAEAALRRKMEKQRAQEKVKDEG